MNNWRNRGNPELQQQQNNYAQQERSEHEEAAVAVRRQISEDSYQRLMTKLTADRTSQIRQTAHLRQVASDQAAVVLKAQSWVSYNGSAERFEQEWPTIHAQLLADSEKRQHEIDRALGPYSLSATGLMPHRAYSADPADMLVPGAWRGRTRGTTTYPDN